MSGMPDTVVMGYLDEVILGDLSVAGFKKKCQKYKCTQRFKLAVANHVETLLNRDQDDAWDNFPDSDEGDDYNDARWNWVVENLSVLADEPFINTYVKMRYNAPVKEPFPEALFEDCQRVYNALVVKGQ